ERAEASKDLCFAGGRLGDARQNSQEGALSGPVAPDDAESLATPDLERDVPQGPDRLVLATAGPTQWTGRHRHQGLPKGPIPGLAFMVDSIGLAQAFRADRDVRHQITSAKLRSIRLKTMAPRTRMRTAIATDSAMAVVGTGPPSRAQRNPSITPTIGLSP